MRTIGEASHLALSSKQDDFCRNDSFFPLLTSELFRSPHADKSRLSSSLLLFLLESAGKFGLDPSGGLRILVNITVFFCSGSKVLGQSSCWENHFPTVGSSLPRKQTPLLHWQKFSGKVFFVFLTRPFHRVWKLISTYVCGLCSEESQAGF